MPPIETDDLIVLLLGAQTPDAAAEGRIDGITRLEKLVFLIEKAGGFEDLKTDSGFIPHHFGPFSAEIYRAVDVLVAASLITDTRSLLTSDEESWEARHLVGAGAYEPRSFALTERGRRYFEALAAELPPSDIAKLSRFKEQFGTIPLRQLIRYVYEQYPPFTAKSVIKDDILR